MFTGIVQATGEITSVGGGSIWVGAPTLDDAALGASVAVNGVCLTVAARRIGEARFDLSDETLSRTTLGSLPRGDSVNLERPLRAGDELGGHIVQGHVDGVGVVLEAGARLRVSVPEGLGRYVVEKGSITVDGVSLTVTDTDASSFGAALVPHTLDVTTLGTRRAGDGVNIEVDVLAKYLERLVAPAVARTEYL